MAPFSASSVPFIAQLCNGLGEWRFPGNVMGGDGVWWAEGVKKEVQAVYNGDDLNEATGGQRILLAGGWTLGLAL